MIRRALDRLAAAGIPFTTRGEQPIDDPPPERDVDILVGARDLARVRRVLEEAGFHSEPARGHRGHRFFLAFDRDRGLWRKIDVNVVPRRLGWDLTARDEASLRRFAQYRVGVKANPGRLERAWSELAWRLPLSWRRRGAVVAVLGPDGAGKGSVIAALDRQVPMWTTPMYLGLGVVSRAEYRPQREPARSGWRAGLSALRGALRRAATRWLAADVVEAQYRVRQALHLAAMTVPAHVRAWRGHLVLCDRHPIEQLAVAQPAAPWVAALERRLLRRLIPWPDAIVVLDAPAEVLFARKGEHSPAVLEELRSRYREVLVPRGARVVSSAGPLEQTVSEVAAVAWEAVSARRGW